MSQLTARTFQTINPAAKPKALPNPMSHVLSRLKDCRNLLGIADEHLFEAQDRLDDVIDTPHDPGLGADDAVMLMRASIKLQALHDELVTVALYFRAKANIN